MRAVMFESHDLVPGDTQFGQISRSAKALDPSGAVLGSVNVQWVKEV